MVLQTDTSRSLVKSLFKETLMPTLKTPLQWSKKMQTSIPNIYIIVPAYNEGSVIEQTIRPLLSLGYHIVVIDDGSTDDTYEQACQLSVCVLRHPINLGQGAALRTGTDFAIQQGAQAIVHFDADGQHPPERIHDLLAPILNKEAQIVLGSRFLDSEHSKEIPTLKKWVLKLGVSFTGITSGVWLTDTHNGLRALSREGALAIRITEPRMAHASEIVTLIGKHKLTYREVPTHIRYTEYAQQKGQSIFNAFNIVIDLLLRKVFR
jgi:polyprenyl-phospho-N-acetylgalactosaminyl synthase